MLFQLMLLSLTAVSGILGDCTGSIIIEGVSTSFGNDVVNGEYQLAPVGECNDRDIFQKGTEEFYLYHINSGVRGYWIFRNFYLCEDNSDDQGYVRADDLEFNPGLIQRAWEEKVSDGNWDADVGIDVDCIPVKAKKAKVPAAENTKQIGAKDVAKGMPDCTGSIIIEGVSTSFGNDVVNGEYQLAPVGECNDRDIFQKGTEEFYLYHINSGIRGYWIFRNFYLCEDNSEDQGYVRADDLEFNPGLIQGSWEEKVSDGNWDSDFGIDVDCIPAKSKKAKVPVAENTNEVGAHDAVKGRADVMNVSMGASKPIGITMSILLVVTALWRVFL